MDADLDHVGAAPGMEVLGGGDQLVPGATGGEHVQLHLDGGEVVARRQVPEGLPGGDRVGERDPGAAVNQPAGVQVAPVDDDPPVERSSVTSSGSTPRSAGKLSATRARSDSGVTSGLPWGMAAESICGYPLKVERPASPKGSSRSRTASPHPASAARRWNA